MLSKVRLKNFVDYDSIPVSLIKNGNSLFNLNFSTTDGKNINTSDLYFEPTLNSQWRKTGCFNEIHGFRRSIY